MIIIIIIITTDLDQTPCITSIRHYFTSRRDHQANPTRLTRWIRSAQDPCLEKRIAAALTVAFGFPNI